MKVLFTIWILAVVIQEVIPGTLVRLPRSSLGRKSSVQTEYEAKYAQKGEHGHQSFSTVTGKQEIVHDDCGENWNAFAEKCATLIKDLIASLATAVKSNPGDATNLQLHIKNNFKHFDNTHNCSCLSHAGSGLKDLDLSPLFNNITITTSCPSKSGLGTGVQSGAIAPVGTPNISPIGSTSGNKVVVIPESSGINPQDVDSLGEGLTINSRRNAEVVPNGAVPHAIAKPVSVQPDFSAASVLSSTDSVPSVSPLQSSESSGSLPAVEPIGSAPGTQLQELPINSPTIPQAGEDCDTPTAVAPDTQTIPGNLNQVSVPSLNTNPQTGIDKPLASAVPVPPQGALTPANSESSPIVPTVPESVGNIEPAVQSPVAKPLGPIESGNQLAVPLTGPEEDCENTEEKIPSALPAAPLQTITSASEPLSNVPQQVANPISSELIPESVGSVSSELTPKIPQASSPLDTQTSGVLSAGLQVPAVSGVLPAEDENCDNVEPTDGNSIAPSPAVELEQPLKPALPGNVAPDISEQDDCKNSDPSSVLSASPQNPLVSSAPVPSVQPLNPIVPSAAPPGVPAQDSSGILAPVPQQSQNSIINPSEVIPNVSEQPQNPLAPSSVDQIGDGSIQPVPQVPSVASQNLASSVPSITQNPSNLAAPEVVPIESSAPTLNSVPLAQDSLPSAPSGVLNPALQQSPGSVAPEINSSGVLPEENCETPETPTAIPEGSQSQLNPLTPETVQSPVQTPGTSLGSTSPLTSETGPSTVQQISPVTNEDCEDPKNAETINLLPEQPIGSPFPAASQIPVNSAAPSIVESPMSSVDPTLSQPPLNSVPPTVVETPTASIDPGLSQNPITPALSGSSVNPIAQGVNESPVNPIDPAFGQSLVDTAAPGVVESPISPVDPQFSQSPIRPAAPGIGESPVSPIDSSVGQSPVPPALSNIPINPISSAVGESPVSPVDSAVVQSPVPPTLGNIPPNPISPSVGESPVSPVDSAVVQSPVPPPLNDIPTDPISPSVGESPVRPVSPVDSSVVQSPVPPALSTNPINPISPAVGESPGSPVDSAVVQSPVPPALSSIPTNPISPAVGQNPVSPVDSVGPSPLSPSISQSPVNGVVQAISESPALPANPGSSQSPISPSLNQSPVNSVVPAVADNQIPVDPGFSQSPVPPSLSQTPVGSQAVPTSPETTVIQSPTAIAPSPSLMSASHLNEPVTSVAGNEKEDCDKSEPSTVLPVGSVESSGVLGTPKVPVGETSVLPTANGPVQSTGSLAGSNIAGEPVSQTPAINTPLGEENCETPQIVPESPVAPQTVPGAANQLGGPDAGAPGLSAASPVGSLTPLESSNQLGQPAVGNTVLAGNVPSASVPATSLGTKGGNTGYILPESLNPSNSFQSEPVYPTVPSVPIDSLEDEDDLKPTTYQTTSVEPTRPQSPPILTIPLSHTMSPNSEEEQVPCKPSTIPKDSTHEVEDEDEGCCSCESCTDDIANVHEYRVNACKDLEDARRELKAIFDKIKKRLKCGKKFKAIPTITTTLA